MANQTTNREALKRDLDRIDDERFAKREAIQTLKQTHVTRHGESIADLKIVSVEVSKDGSSAMIAAIVPCWRCDHGTYRCGGSINGVARFSGECFRCGGLGRKEEKQRVYTPERIAELDAAQVVKAEKEAEKGVLEFAQQAEEQAELFATISKLYQPKGLFADMQEQIAAGRRAFTESQIAAAQEWIESAVQQSERALGWKKEREANDAKDAASEYVGEVGERIEFTAEVVALKSGGDQWNGYWTFYLLRDTTTSNLLVYLGNADLCGARGDTVTVKATVKEHSTRDGVKQTKVLRPKLVDVIYKEEV